LKALLKDVEQLKNDNNKLSNENKELVIKFDQQLKSIENENKENFKIKNDEINRLNKAVEDAELL
jgi:hypothetical protein